MQRFAHGAEVRLEPGSLGGGDAEGDGKLPVVQTKHPAGSGGRREGADRAGDVETLLVMAGRDEPADAAGGLVARDEAFDEQSARGLRLFAERQQGGHDGDGGMAAHREVHVVIVEGVAGGAVDQGRGRGQHGLGAADESRGTLGAIFQRLGDQDAGQLLLCTGHGDGKPVEQALLGALDQIVRQVLPGKGGGALGDFGRDRNDGCHVFLLNLWRKCRPPAAVLSTIGGFAQRYGPDTTKPPGGGFVPTIGDPVTGSTKPLQERSWWRQLLRSPAS